MEIVIENLAKVYGNAHAVRDFSVTIAKGEMVALLGPSGCGKTTTLRMVAGFIKPSAGRIVVRGRDLTGLPPHKRDTGLVFQNYALFPHLTVAENIAFGLRRRGVPAAERDTRVANMIATMQLTGLADRLPRQLSGGQQQRVAVARALVINPSILLLDEPFSNLDAKLRESTGLELRRIQRELGLTSIFVTHDQNEAMAIADRIAVMNGGAVEQIGSAVDIYERPRTRFVADFIGSANFLSATVEARDGNVVTLRHGLGVSVLPVEGQAFDKGRSVTLMVRPECVAIHPAAAEAGLGTIETISYQGSSAHIFVKLRDGDRTMLVERHGRELAGLEVGKTVDLNVKAQDLTLFAA
ncbi:ABC transporter ATP-binding protein [Chelatococcus asaccharovorans]|uniref:Putative spermidine/putrescine transport system ATP-binding protein n=1 Tax=Chelatococcus asaccharovorans TaxID=28210 RepID=A0A2V3UDT1_9HYPH|nr:ABC transporter ATP-binding protein [Chelatococcus asaccharovorans]MBS7702190.1 ABC transporter ATP-binding protein [Chelatococcus asaccharovorans]PXW56612.1 putative spermidine/putrescine transport system ATP-binding protein [Chelatococcus asaccharovorans]